MPYRSNFTLTLLYILFFTSCFTYFTEKASVLKRTLEKG